MKDDLSDNGAGQFYDEVHNVVRRYMNEAPDMTLFQMIGAIEAVKGDLLEALKNHNEI